MARPGGWIRGTEQEVLGRCLGPSVLLGYKLERELCSFHRLLPGLLPLFACTVFSCPWEPLPLFFTYAAEPVALLSLQRTTLWTNQHLDLGGNLTQSCYREGEEEGLAAPTPARC